MPRPRPVHLEFDPALAFPHEKKPLRDNLSVAVRTGRNLWVASDEATSLERLTELGTGRFAAHARFPLHDWLDMPGDPDDEVDIEGLGHDDGYLWLVGSHGLKRKKPKGDEAEGIARLARVTADANRYLLARIPCVANAEGDHVLAREAELAAPPRRGAKAAKGAKSAASRTLVAARLAGDDEGSELTKAVAKDEHLAPFLGIPGKDNGFDIEGLAVNGERIYLGLRGPVLRGWAVILSVVLVPDESDPRTLHLAEQVVGRDDKEKKVERGYARHFIYLGGMGVRELRAAGDDLLILAGPTMQLDGTIALFRWKGGARADRDCLVPDHAVERLFDVPHGTGADTERDRAEGMALWPVAEGRRGPACELLVVYDSPREKRCRGEAGVVADLFPIPPAVAREARRGSSRGRKKAVGGKKAAKPKKKKQPRRATPAVAAEDDLAPGDSLAGRLFAKLGI